MAARTRLPGRRAPYLGSPMTDEDNLAHEAPPARVQPDHLVHAVARQAVAAATVSDLLRSSLEGEASRVAAMMAPQMKMLSGLAEMQSIQAAQISRMIGPLAKVLDHQRDLIARMATFKLPELTVPTLSPQLAEILEKFDTGLGIGRGIDPVVLGQVTSAINKITISPEVLVGLTSPPIWGRFMSAASDAEGWLPELDDGLVAEGGGRLIRREGAWLAKWLLVLLMCAWGGEAVGTTYDARGGVEAQNQAFALVIAMVVLFTWANGEAD